MKYKYTAVSEKGEKIEGILATENEETLAEELREDGFILTSAKKVSEKRSLRLPKRVSLKDKIFFVRNLQVMLSAKLPLSRALNSLGAQTKNEKLKEIIHQLKEDIKGGKKFSEALLEHPRVFSSFFFNMIKSGEETGRMEEVLKNLSEQMENEHKLKSNILGALIYPAVVISVMLIMLIIMLIVVIPRMAEVFHDMDLALPLFTRMIVSFSEFLAGNFIIIIFIIILLAIVARAFFKTDTGNKFLSFVILKTPLISSFSKKKNSAHISRTLSSLMTAGISINTGMDIVRQTLNNFYFKQAVSVSAEKIKSGESFSDAIAEHGEILSPLLIEMTQVGEETGETSEVLLKAASFLEEEVERGTMNLTTFIEPILLVIIGGAIGFFAFSMLMPMYSLMDAL